MIDDNLKDISLKEGVLKVVDSLEISTIDILKAIIDECNIMGAVPSDFTLNIPKAKYKMQIISFDGVEQVVHRELQDYIKSRLVDNETVAGWLGKTVGAGEGSGKTKRNMDLVEDMFDCSLDISWWSMSTLGVYMGKRIRHGTVSSDPDKYGFFTFETDWNETRLCCLCYNTGIPSLYRGNL